MGSGFNVELEVDPLDPELSLLFLLQEKKVAPRHTIRKNNVLCFIRVCEFQIVFCDIGLSPKLMLMFTKRLADLPCFNKQVLCAGIFIR